MFGKIHFEYDLSKDKKFVEQIEKEASYLVCSMLNHKEKGDDFIEMLASALSRYFSWKNTTIEAFLTKVVKETVAGALKDKSTLSTDEKAEAFIVQIVRDAVKDVVKEKLKDIKITGL